MAAAGLPILYFLYAGAQLAWSEGLTAGNLPHVPFDGMDSLSLVQRSAHVVTKTPEASVVQDTCNKLLGDGGDPNEQSAESVLTLCEERGLDRFCDGIIEMLGLPPWTESKIQHVCARVGSQVELAARAYSLAPPRAEGHLEMEEELVHLEQIEHALSGKDTARHLARQPSSQSARPPASGAGDTSSAKDDFFSKSPLPWASTHQAPPPPKEGYVQHGVATRLDNHNTRSPKAEVSPSLSCGPDYQQLDFQGSTVVNSNLGGMGPDSVSNTFQGITFANIAAAGNPGQPAATDQVSLYGRTVGDAKGHGARSLAHGRGGNPGEWPAHDRSAAAQAQDLANSEFTGGDDHPRPFLVITNTSFYDPKHTHANGNSGGFGMINVRCGTSVGLKFSLYDRATGHPMTLDKFYLTFYDIAHHDWHTQESLVLGHYDQLFTAQDTNVVIQEENDGTAESPMKIANVLANPLAHHQPLTTIDETTVEQAKNSVTALYSGKSSVEVILKAENCPTGRNFFFSGKSVMC